MGCIPCEQDNRAHVATTLLSIELELAKETETLNEQGTKRQKKNWFTAVKPKSQLIIRRNKKLKSKPNVREHTKNYDAPVYHMIQSFLFTRFTTSAKNNSKQWIQWKWRIKVVFRCCCSCWKIQPRTECVYTKVFILCWVCDMHNLINRPANFYLLEYNNKRIIHPKLHIM